MFLSSSCWKLAPCSPPSSVFRCKVHPCYECLGIEGKAWLCLPSVNINISMTTDNGLEGGREEDTFTPVCICAHIHTPTRSHLQRLREGERERREREREREATREGGERDDTRLFQMPGLLTWHALDREITKHVEKTLIFGWGCSILKKAGSPGLQVDPSKIVWTPYNAEREYANYRN
jgi:hypothetical protein